MHSQHQPVSPPLQSGTDHLSGQNWEKINQLHAAKVIAEFSHEGLLQPEIVDNRQNDYRLYRLDIEGGTIHYTFEAKNLLLNHWIIRPETLRKTVQGNSVPLDSLQLVIELKTLIAPEVFPSYLEEVASTVHAMAFTYHHGKPDVDALVHADYQELEGAMTGHPRFIANNGRIGFNFDDYQKYAPETASPFTLIWIAGDRDKAVFTGISSLDYQSVLNRELDHSTKNQWDGLMIDKGLDPSNYYYFPVHPWQWTNVLSILFSADIAGQKLVYLGKGKDEYLPQQSIRTFYNCSRPERFYVKTAVGLLNMGYVRGLSPYFMQTNPGINEWLQAMLAKDGYLQQTGFTILREVASVSFEHSYFEAALSKDSHYKKMLACLWRESPGSQLQKGQRLMTMAALLHVDQQGTALLPRLIQASGIAPNDWINAYLRCYLHPLLHCFYRYDMVFMPHGENLILVMEDHVPVKAIMKDIGEEVSLFTPDYPVPQVAQRLVVQLEGQERTLPIFTQLFDSIFRFIAAILVESQAMTEEVFWKAVASAVQNYQELHPEMKEKFEAYDLFAPSFEPDALNKLQLSNNRKLRDRSKPFTGLPTVGKLENPIAQLHNL